MSLFSRVLTSGPLALATTACVLLAAETATARPGRAAAPCPAEAADATAADCPTPPVAEPTPAESETPPPVQGTPGGAGVGDAYFPSSGNTGYDAGDYQVDLRYAPKSRSVDATVTMTATATQDLSAFDLDYRGPKVLSVMVGGSEAGFRRAGGKLIVTPAAAIADGAGFTTVVHYAGRPGPIGNPDLGTYGWVPSRDGAIVVSEPDGAPTWIPVDDHPSDKATYTFRVTVPKGLQVVANGEPDPPVSQGATTTYTWHERLPMASYLATIGIGHFLIRRGMAGTIPVITAVDPRFAKAAGHLYDTTAKAITWESTLFGPYPFRTAGGIIDDPRLDYALETQERPVYGGFSPDDDFIVHELAHQWFGDSVSLKSWADIWLNEGFATYAEWLWHERTGKDSAKKTFKRYYRQPATSPIFNPPPGRPGRSQMFSFSVYIRGAMCLEALRERVGTAAFFKIIRAWAAQHEYGNATAAQFEALAEQLSHKKLGGLFDAWLNTKNKPKHW